MVRVGLRAAILVSVCCVFGACSTFSEAPEDDGVSPLADGGNATDGPSAEEAATDAPSGADGGASFFPLTTALLSSLRDVAADEQWVYVSEQGNGGVYAFPLPGNSAQAKYVHAAAPTGLAVSGTMLFWFDNNDSKLYAWDYAQSSSPRSGNVEVRPLSSLAISGKFLVSVMQKRPGDAAGAVQLRLQSTPDTASINIDSANPFDVAVNGSDLYWTDNATIRHVDLDSGGSPDDYALCGSDCEYIAADNAGVYWTRTYSNAVEGKLAGSSIVQKLGAYEQGPTAIASDASGVYWTTKDAKIRRWTASDDNTVDVVSGGFPILDDLNARVSGVDLEIRYLAY